MTVKLEPCDFAAFFTELYQVPPFPWQEGLVREVDGSQRWPELFDLPTACGKTSIIDVAVFLLALDAQHPAEERWAPRRIVMVVDRRVVVDQAYEHARRLATALRERRSEMVGAVADSLSSLTDDTGEPLAAVALRGGVMRDQSWIRRPDQPLVISSTVDQVGSRLLFQGYGVAPGMQPIHAGLLGTDALVALDEVHLSEPFAQTLRAIRARYQQVGTVPLPSRWHFTELSATPRPIAAGPNDQPWIFWLNHDYRGDPEGARTLAQRLDASKPTTLVSVKTTVQNDEQARGAIAKAASYAASEMIGQPGIHAVGIVVNRVDTAHKTFEELQGSGPDVVLLTGRMRALERDRLVKAIAGRLDPARDRGGQCQPLIVVATQCIEAGVDFDFDALVTECSSIDSLRQRFGRLDRIGWRTAAGLPAPAVVLGPACTVRANGVDPVYGEAIPATWDWLQSVSRGGELDFGINSMRLPKDERLRSSRAEAPHLLSTHLDIWTETPLDRHQDRPPVARWLHGTDEVDIDVQVVWRADLTREQLDAALSQNPERRPRLQVIRDILAFCRPLSGEALAVPLSAVRAWLGDEDASGAVSDVEGMLQTGIEVHSADLRPFVVWAGDDSTVGASAGDLRPGCTIVVPSTYGGLWREVYEGVTYGWWAPASREPVIDVGDSAHEAYGARSVARLFPLGTLGSEHADRDVPSPLTRSDDLDARTHLLASLDLDELGFSKSQKGHLLVREFRVELDCEAVLAWYAIAARLSRDTDKPSGDSTVDSDPETSPFTGAYAARLDEHLDGVGLKAYDFGRRCGLKSEVVADLRLAGELHDFGKADERFQSWMRDGTARTTTQPMLAKSTTPAFDRRARELARVQSGYPKGTRHEAMSLAMIDGNASPMANAHDWALVEHLVMSHHGWGRPFVPPVRDDHPQRVILRWGEEEYEAMSNHGLAQLDSGVADRFWSLVRRYGWYRLAWLETLLRLADHRRSEEEQTRLEARHG